MSYQMSFSGSLSFPSAQHLEAGLDALFLDEAPHRERGLITLDGLSSPQPNKLDLDYSCSAPASAWDTQLERLRALVSYASAGKLNAEYDGTLTEQLRAKSSPMPPPQADAPPRWAAYFALLRGDYQALERHLNEGVAPDEVYPSAQALHGESLLWRATDADDLVGMRLLLDRGATPNTARMGTPALSAATSLAAQEMLQTSGATINDDTFTQGWWADPELLLSLLNDAPQLAPKTYQHISFNALLERMMEVLEQLAAQGRFSLDDEQRADGRELLEEDEEEEDEDAQALLAWLDAH